jgi:hypothetical protein
MFLEYYVCTGLGKKIQSPLSRHFLGIQQKGLEKL